MAKTARNAPCPCGSGRKFKQCCQLEEERLGRQARGDCRVGRSISDWSVEEFGDELAEAFEEFHPESDRVGERDFALLLTWFNSDRELSGGGTPVARYLARSDLDPVEREVAARIAAAKLGLHRVRAVVPGCSLELEDVLTGAVIPVASQTVSCEVVRWDIVLCRVVAGEPLASLWGPVLVYAPDEEAELLAELERLAAAYGLSRDRAKLSEIFRIASRELLQFVSPSRLAEPSYFTAEGDPIVSASVAEWKPISPAS
ncbi:MAG: YecA family protein, partial [Gaiellaceae bacterium]